MPVWILYFVALVEWFSTLAVQIVAMRLAIPVVGSSIVLTSIFLWVILLALSVWYYHGWVVAERLDRVQIIKTLWFFLLFAGVRYVLISFALEKQLLEAILVSTNNYILTLFVVSTALFFLPVFVASHTIPLLTELLPDTSKGKAAGKMLFASTVWSFLWSVVTSIVLFQRLGVHSTGVRVGAGLVLLSTIVFNYSSRRRSIISWVAWILLLVWFLSQRQTDMVYSMDTAYQQIDIFDREIGDRPVRVFSLNGAFSSAIYLDNTDETPFQYLTEAIKITKNTEPENILVIWAAWFVYPEIVSKLPYIKQVDTVDIDPQVQDLAEKYFLEKELDPKITFYPYSARYITNQLWREGKQYDLIFLDAYNGKSMPAELVTQEFFAWVQWLLSEEWFMLANVILDTDLESDFSQWVLSTIDKVFDTMFIRNITNNPDEVLDNIMVSTIKLDQYVRSTIEWSVYTDNDSRAELDGVEMLYMQ